MISDLTTSTGTGIVPHGNADMVQTALGITGTVQPVRDVQAYLAGRAAQPHYQGEEGLLITLPVAVQKEVKALVRACHFVAGLVKDRWSVQTACVEVIRIYHEWKWKLNTFRPKFEAWQRAKDWISLVNRSKAPAAWRDGNAGLPAEFLRFVEIRLGQFGRSSDGKRQAIFSVHRQWRTGKDMAGDHLPVAGYEAVWKNRDTENLPVGWSYDNICRQIKARGKYTPGVRALLHEGESAARQFLPQVLGTRRNLRFMEKITFDDVRTDWLIFNPESGQAEELWLLVARDEATAMVLGFVMHPATVREDGKAAHLGARHMKELAGYLLQTYPLPPYLVHWVVERGTATLAEAVKAALAELFNERIVVHYTSMIGVKSPAGYKEKAKGNSRGKASHEAHNRLFHTAGSYVAGQTGAHYSIRPADLKARSDEAHGIWLDSRNLPVALRDEVKYPLPTLHKARAIIQELCLQQNFRKEHRLEGFEEVLEWFDGKAWQPAATAPAGVEFKRRMEMPVERAVRLIRSVEKWDRVSPDVVVTFLEHSQRFVTVTEKGEIKFDHQDRTLIFAHGGIAIAPETKALAYFNPNDPEFLHLTSGDGRILGTWYQRGRTAYLDQEALAKAMRYTHAAREAAMATARELAAPQIAELAAMREHNAGLEQFVVTGNVPAAIGAENGSAVAAGVAGARAERGTFTTDPPVVEPVADNTQEFLERAKESPAQGINWD